VDWLEGLSADHSAEHLQRLSGGGLWHLVATSLDGDELEGARPQSTHICRRKGERRGGVRSDGRRSEEEMYVKGVLADNNSRVYVCCDI
jgi:hypothetical protein